MYICFETTVRLRCRILVAGLFTLILCSSVCVAATCPSSTSSLTAISTLKYTISGYYTDTYGVVAGQVTNSFYYLNNVFMYYMNYKAILMKVDAFGNQSWLSYFDSNPKLKSLSIDTTEQYVHFAICDYAKVLRIKTNSGGIESQHEFSGMYCSDDTKVWLLSDNSGYFINLRSEPSPYYAILCKYTFSSSNAQCQSITNIYFGYGSLMLSNTQFFLLGRDYSSPYPLHMYKIKFSSTSVEWANKMYCISSYCNSYYSDSLLSKDGSNMYLFFAYGNSAYIYFASLSVSTGSVASARYKSNFGGYVYGSTLNGDYVIATANNYLLIYSISSNSFTTKYTSANFYDCEVEPSTGRVIIAGRNYPYGYISKFYIQSINDHPDISSANVSMITLSTGVEEIYSDNGITIGSLYDKSISSPGFTTRSESYYVYTNYTSDIRYQLNDKSISILESTSSTFTFDLTCSFSGSTPISYSAKQKDTSINGYSNVPSWVSIDSNTGALTVNAPSVESDTVLKIDVFSTYSGAASPIKKLIILTVDNCKESGCQKCADSKTSICQTCNDDYTLHFGHCFQNSSTAGKVFGIFVLCLVILTFLISVAISCKSSTSMASYWAMISQMQMLFLLLTRWLSSDDVREVIRISKFTMNLYYYIPLSKNRMYDSLFSETDVGLADYFIKDVGIYSNSSIYNIFCIFTWMFYICLFHIGLHFLQGCVKKISEDGKCKDIVKAIKWCFAQIYEFMNFRFYMRNLFMLCQFILISSFYDMATLTNGGYRVFSMLFAIFLLLFYISVTGVIIYLIFSKRQANARIIEYLKELFSEVKELKRHKLHLAIFFIRRIVYTFILVGLRNVSSKAAIGIITHFQFYYIVYILIIRPYKEAIVNIIEIGNEIFFFIIICVLNFFYQEESWSSLNSGLYMTLIVLNIIFISATISTHGVILLIKIIKEKSTALRNEDLSVIQMNNSVVEPSVEEPPIQIGIPAVTHNIPANRITEKSMYSIEVNEMEEESKIDPFKSVNQM